MAGRARYHRRGGDDPHGGHRRLDHNRGRRRQRRRVHTVGDLHAGRRPVLRQDRQWLQGRLARVRHLLGRQRLHVRHLRRRTELPADHLRVRRRRQVLRHDRRRLRDEAGLRRCATGDVCTAGVCVKAGCVPLTCKSATTQYCGTIGDGCGGTLACGDCAAGIDVRRRRRTGRVRPDQLHGDHLQPDGRRPVLRADRKRLRRRARLPVVPGRHGVRHRRAGRRLPRHARHRRRLHRPRLPDQQVHRDAQDDGQGDRLRSRAASCRSTT